MRCSASSIPSLPPQRSHCRRSTQATPRRYNELLAPTIPLSRHIFAAPTYNYKTGIVFLAWLNGFQPHFRMVGGAETARSRTHLVELFQLADAASLLRNPELALQRMKIFLTQEAA